MPVSDSDPEITRFLADASNVETAYDLVAELPRAAEALFLKFWRTVGKSIQRALEKRKLQHEWELHFFDEDDHNISLDSDFPISDEYAGLELEPRRAPDQADASILACTFALEYWRPGFPPKKNDTGGVYYGIRFSRGLRKVDVPLVRRLTGNLKKHLESRRWTYLPAAAEDEWWVGTSEYLWCLAPLNGTMMLGKKEAIALAQGEELERLTEKAFLDFFDKERREVGRINRALVQATAPVHKAKGARRH